MQGSDVECFASQPGLVQTELNGRKLDHRKLTAISVDIAAKVMGKDARSASLCLQRPATDPTVTGMHPLLSCAQRLIGCMHWMWPADTA